jgi:transposase
MSLKGSQAGRLGIEVSVRNTEQLSLEQIRAFLAASQEIEFEAAHRKEVYEWITRTLCRQEYWKQKREGKGLLRRYLSRMTGLSRAQVTRLLNRYRETGVVGEQPYRRNRFARRSGTADIELLAAVEKADETMSGPATQKILCREFHDYGHQQYERLAGICPAHIYNLRKSRAYRNQRVHYRKTRPVGVAIGERRRPEPQGRPGYLRVIQCIREIWTGSKGCTTSMR